jgi:hypothetical protein
MTQYCWHNVSKTSVYKKVSKMWSSFSAGMPWPESLTSISMVCVPSSPRAHSDKPVLRPSFADRIHAVENEVQQRPSIFASGKKFVPQRKLAAQSNTQSWKNMTGLSRNSFWQRRYRFCGSRPRMKEIFHVKNFTLRMVGDDVALLGYEPYLTNRRSNTAVQISAVNHIFAGQGESVHRRRRQEGP